MRSTLEETLHAPTDGRDGSPELRDLITRHQVYWQVWPEYRMSSDDALVKVGFQLGLFGTHDHPQSNPIAGCGECVKVYRDLHRIARSILPPEGRESRYEVGIFEGALSASRSASRRDILLTIKVLHRHQTDGPIDDCEVRCLEEMKEKLHALGALAGNWTSSTSTAVQKGDRK
jgi:hypothetical protein